MIGSDEAALTNRSERHPWWAIAGLAAIGVLALALYTWSLSRNGMANSYYAAAVKSATVSWKAFFFGSLDPGSFITVDKPPAAIWVMALSARVFGFSTWSMLLPQALAGVASVLILHRLVRRWAGDVAGLIAALVLALTPVAVLLFRYNNPDAFLTLLLLLAAWAVWSAVERGSTLMLSLAGVVLGFAFLTKMLMALMVVPAFLVVYLACGPNRLGRRIVQSVVALAALLLSGGWWLAIVESWPEATRPYVGGTMSNSWLGLIFGRTGGYLGGSTQAGQMSGEPGVLRVFNIALGSQVSWFLPLALAGLAAGLWLARGRPRTDRKRAGYLLWGLWVVVMILVFDFAQGTFHSYYTIVLVPGIAALTGAGCIDLWRLSRSRWWLTWLLPAAVAGSAVWSAVLLGRVTDYAPGLAIAVIALGAIGAAIIWALLAMPLTDRSAPLLRGRWNWIIGGVAGVICVAALAAGPFAYDLSTIGRSVTGNAAVAGPGTVDLAAIGPGGVNSASDIGNAGDEALGVDEALVSYLQERQGETTFLVAVETSSASVPIILATGEPVVTIGGYKSRDPVPTIERLESMVAYGELHYAFLAEGDVSASSSLSGGAGETAEAVVAAVIQWIVDHGTIVPVDEYGGDSSGTLYFLP